MCSLLSDKQNNHTLFMQRALQLAQKGWGTTHPNPMVGAVVVEKGVVVAEGFHEKAGEAHAEVRAIEQWIKGRKTQSFQKRSESTLYITLEPCSSNGRTPPCTEKIIQSQIKRVVIGTLDPNPKHSGKGIEILRKAGVEVETGILDKDCTQLNLIFNHWITQNTPLFAGKAAVTLDGKIATRESHSKWISGDIARQDVMRWRRYFEAIAVGANTVLMDNPVLTSRLDQKNPWCPIRFVFDRNLKTVQEKKLPLVYQDEFQTKTIVVTDVRACASRQSVLKNLGISIWTFNDTDQSHAFFNAFRRRCTEEGITGVFFEGGSTLLSALLGSQQLDYLFIYQAPKFLGDAKALPLFQGQTTPTIDKAYRFKEVEHSILGDDSLTRGKIVYP